MNRQSIMVLLATALLCCVSSQALAAFEAPDAAKVIHKVRRSLIRVSGTSIAEPAIPVGNDPVAVAITPDGTMAYVVNRGDGTVTPITTATNIAGAPITVGPSPTAIAIAPDGKNATPCG